MNLADFKQIHFKLLCVSVFAHSPLYKKNPKKQTVKHRKFFQSLSTQSTFLSTGVSSFDRISLKLNWIQPGQQKGISAGRQDSGLLSKLEFTGQSPQLWCCKDEVNNLCSIGF